MAVVLGNSQRRSKLKSAAYAKRSAPIKKDRTRFETERQEWRVQDESTFWPPPYAENFPEWAWYQGKGSKQF